MFKNILATAALVAASSALASAASVTTFTDLTTSSTVDGVTYSDGYITVSDSTTGTLFTNGVSSSIANCALITIVLDYDAISAAAASSESGILLVNAQVSESDTTSSIGLVANSTGIDYAWGGSQWEKSTLSSSVSWDSTYLEVDENDYLVLTLLVNSVTANSSGSTRIYTDPDGSYYWTNTSLKATQYAYSAVYVNSAYVLGITVTASDTTDIASTSTALVEAVIAASIPEPSAFGLIAGIGALALVAARRRRR